MISITRDLARQLRAVLRKAGAGKNLRPAVELHTGLGELHVRAQLTDIVIEYKQQGPLEQEALSLPSEALEDFEGKSSATVTLSRTSQGVEASWEDGRIPKRKSYEVKESATGPTVPQVDWSKKVMVPGFLQALAQASQCVASDNFRYATTRIQIRGGQGEIIASDGRQALIQSGFTFSWKEDLLIPGVALFGCRELPLDQPATVCKGETHVALQVGDWTIYLEIDKTGRFPEVAKAIPNVPANATTLRLCPEDAEFLAQTLGKLPGNHDDFAPITVDLNGQVALRAKEEGQTHPTEVVLAGSTVAGSPVCMHSDRRFLARALSLGFAELTIIADDKPILCKDKTRTYVWVPLAKNLVIAPSDKATRITTQVTAPEETSPSKPDQEGKNPMAQNHTNGDSNSQANHQEAPTKTNTLAGLITEAQSLRDYLHDGYVQASRLVTSLKNHRKQSKLVASTLASLRQLQQIEA